MPRLFVLILLSFILTITMAHAAEYRGLVVSVHDGDTITILIDSQQQEKIRLNEIDAPELSQPYGRSAKQALSALIYRKTVTVNVDGVDQYGRTLGRVYLDKTDVNAELVRLGAAWVYRRYSHDQNLIELEAEAKRASMGLWSLPTANQIPPWEWRKAARARHQPSQVH